MKTRMLLVAASMAALMVLVSSCEKKSNPTSATDPAAAAQKVTLGNDILFLKIALIANSGTIDTTAFDFSSASTLYLEALGLDPANSGAHFGLALIDILSLFGNQDIQALFNARVFSFEPEFVKSLLTVSTKPSDVVSSFVQRMKDLALAPMNNTLPRALGKGSVSLDVPLPSYYQNLIETALLPAVISAITHLAVVLQDPNFVLLITPAMTGGNTTETYRIDATEIYLFSAVLQLFASGSSGAVAYNIDYVPNDSASVYQAWQQTSQFLSLRPNGSQRMNDARTYLLGAATGIQGSLNHLMTEPPNTDVDIIEYNPADQPTFLVVIAGADSLKAALSGPMTFEGAPTINLMTFFTDPIPSYKQMVPSYSISVQAGTTPGTYDVLLTWTASSFAAWTFPDPTMHGVFPGMTDTDLKQWLQIDALNWTQTELIEGF